MRITARVRCLMGLLSQFSTVRFSSQVFVSRLSFYTKQEDFKKLFSQFGVVEEAKLIMDGRTGRTKGFGFITFKTEDEAQKAIKSLDGKIVQGRMIFVEPASNTETDGSDPKSADSQS